MIVKDFNVVGNETFDWTATTFTANRGYEFYYQALGSGPSHFYGSSGYRHRPSGSLLNVGASGTSWSSATSGVYASHLNFSATNVNPFSSGYRATGFPVYCVKE